jgi:hypothetical protein
MRISGPERYKLNFDSDAFAVQCEKGTPKFSGIATSNKPKLYIVSIDNKPIYVGVTKQPIRNRLRLGWSANGESGYYGYAWRHHLTEANIDIWCHEDAPLENPALDIETVEAEVVFLIRCAGQWPLHQTEIHFHPSTSTHRDVAASIMARYAVKPNPAVNQDAPTRGAPVI